MHYRHADTYDREPEGLRPCPADCGESNAWFVFERRPTHCRGCGTRLCCASCGETCATNERGDCAVCASAEPVVLDSVETEFGISLVAREVAR